MPTPATLAKLMRLAETKVNYLEEKYNRARTRAARTGSDADLSEATIIEADLSRAQSHRNSLLMQVRYENRFKELTVVETK